MRRASERSKEAKAAADEQAREERERQQREQREQPQREQQPRRRLETSLSSMASQFLLDAFEKANQGAADAATRNASFDYFGVP